MLNQITEEGTATRPAAAGGRVEVSFTDVAGAPLFTAAHIPVPCDGAVVVCPPILGEGLVNYRREFNLSEHLAAAGLAAQRFHYRGTGQSGGSETDITFGGMVEDALAAHRRLEERVGSHKVAFLGTRWGALVAAACAKRLGGAPLVLWDPVLDPRTFLEEAVRARVMRRLRKGQGRKTSLSQELEELERRGWLDVLGYRLPWSLMESANGHDLSRSLAGRKGPLLSIVFGARGARPPIKAASPHVSDDQWSSGDMVTIDDEVPVWFSGRSSQGSERLLTTTTQWLTDVLRSEGSRS